MLASTMVLMISFYNSHMTFYPNYTAMLSRWFVVTFNRFLYQWPPRPLALVFVPLLALTMVFGYEAFDTKEQEEEERTL